MATVGTAIGNGEGRTRTITTTELLNHNYSIPKKIYRFTPFSLGTMACGFEQSTVLPSLALLGASAWGLGYRALIRGPPRGLGVTVDLLSM